MNKEKLIEIYNQKKDELNRVPKATEFPVMIQREIRRGYGNYFNFLKVQDDFEEYEKRYNHTSYNMLRTISDEQLIQELQDLYKKLGYPPRPKHYAREATVRSHFGSWQNALHKAGIYGTYHNENFSGCISKEELIVRCRRECERLGRFPKWQELKEVHFPVSEIPLYFKNLSDFSLAVGFYSTRIKSRLKALKVLQKSYRAGQKLKDKEEKITYAGVAQEAGLSVNQIRASIDVAKTLGLIRSRTLFELFKVKEEVLFDENVIANLLVPSKTTKHWK